MKTFAKLLVALCIMSGIIFAASQSAFATEVAGNLPVLNGVYAQEQGVIGTEGGYSSNNGKWNYKMSDTSEYKGIFGKNNVPVWYAGSGHSVTFTVDAPKEAKYYIGIQGCCYKSGVRYITVSVNGVETGDNLCEQTNGMTKDVTAEPITMRAGQNVVTLKANGGICRVDHVVFISAESYTEAKEKYDAAVTAEDITAAFGVPGTNKLKAEIAVSSSDLKVYASWTVENGNASKYKISLNDGAEISLDKNSTSYTFSEGVCDGENTIYLTVYDAQGQESQWVKTVTVSPIGGSCGENATWSLNVSGTLTISGAGDMYDYRPAFYNERQPWYNKLGFIKNIIVSEGITGIGNNAFAESAVETVDLPTGLEKIGNQAFFQCSSLKSIYIPDSVQTIGSSAFSFCAIEQINIPLGVTAIGNDAFYNCTSLESIDIPGRVTSIGSSAFSFCENLKSVTMHEGTETIGKKAFQGCKSVTRIDIPDSVTKIEEYAFSECNSLKEVYISKKTEYLMEGVFNNCTSLVHVRVPDEIGALRDKLFLSCTSLETVIIPKNLNWIGENAFWHCTNLKTIYFCGTREEWDTLTADLTFDAENVEVVFAETEGFGISVSVSDEITISADNFEQDMEFLVSTYDEDGNLLEVKRTIARVPRAFSLADAAMIKAFAWGKGFSPEIINITKMMK